jgi:hypothetical protein
MAAGAPSGEVKPIRADTDIGNLSDDERIFLDVLTDRYELFCRKNKDYGSSFRVEGIVGVLVRQGDKFLRLKTISSCGRRIEVETEGLKELLTDIANYCDIGLMLLKERDEQ